MLTLKNTSVMNFENAIRGARNPMNSWGRMDSHTEPDGSFVFGPNDLDLAMRLAKAGSDHRKYLRMVFVSVDVTAPLYWWKEYDTYKVATVANSTSTMHKIHSKPFSMDDFSCDHMTDGTKKFMETVVADARRGLPEGGPAAQGTGGLRRDRLHHGPCQCGGHGRLYALRSPDAPAVF